jgi:hypothetical protein
MAAVRAARGLPPLHGTDPAVIALSRDSCTQRIAAAIICNVDRGPPLSADQIEKLRGLLPYPDDNSTRAA